MQVLTECNDFFFSQQLPSIKKNPAEEKFFIFSDKKNYKGDAYKALSEFKGDIKKINLFKLNKNSLIIDALFGIGLKRNIHLKLGKIFNKINKSSNSIVSIDIPSGVCSNTGKILGYAIKADFTVAFHRKKVGHILGLGKKFSGKIKVVDIGFDQKNMKTQCFLSKHSVFNFRIVFLNSLIKILCILVEKTVFGLPKVQS